MLLLFLLAMDRMYLSQKKGFVQNGGGGGGDVSLGDPPPPPPPRINP